MEVDLPVSQLAGAAGGTVIEVPLDGTGSVIGCLDLDIDIEGLSRNPAHDDMDGLHGVMENARVSAQEGEDFISAYLERNLKVFC